MVHDFCPNDKFFAPFFPFGALVFVRLRGGSDMKELMKGPKFFDQGGPSFVCRTNMSEKLRDVGSATG